jgi:HNH endonuclease
MFELPTPTHLKAPKRKRPDGAGALLRNGYIYLQVDGRRVLQHIYVAEQALGRRLPRGAQVHHVDENRANNRPDNLVICPSAAYHRLIHMRVRALNACGNPNWLKCVYCKRYDAPENLVLSGTSTRHRACDAARKASAYHRKHA